MKLAEIVDIQTDAERLDELNLRKAAATGAFALSTLLAPMSANNHEPSIPAPTSSETAPETSRADMDIALLANTILKKYHVSPELARDVAALAKKHEKESFPKAEDILSIVGIESSFNPKAVSKLKTDPAVGLMQVRPGVWGVNPTTLKSNMDLQIKMGAEVLHKYYKLLGNKASAIHAYNVGLGNFRRGKHNINYVHKFSNERKLYDL